MQTAAASDPTRGEPGRRRIGAEEKRRLGAETTEGGGGRGERGTGPHAPGAGPGKRVPGTGPRTARCKDTEEGTVHRAPPPRHPRPAADVLLRPRATGGPWRGRADVAG